jgi:hypothetical protein
MEETRMMTTKNTINFAFSDLPVGILSMVNEWCNRRGLAVSAANALLALEAIGFKVDEPWLSGNHSTPTVEEVGGNKMNKFDKALSILKSKRDRSKRDYTELMERAAGRHQADDMADIANRAAKIYAVFQAFEDAILDIEDAGEQADRAEVNLV